MNKKTLSLSFLAVATAISAQSKLDFEAGRILDRYMTDCATATTMSTAAHSPVVSAIITLNDMETVEDIRELGAYIFDVTGDIVVADMPLGSIERVAALEGVRHISFGRVAEPMLDKARVASTVNPVHNGEDLNHSYNGSGVVTSLFDTGLDPNHINFKDDSGSSRVALVTTVMGSSAAVTNYTTPEQISNFTTEARNETHGTHVLGIMSGSYHGASEYAGTVSKTSGAMPYYGVATGSEIVVTCGDLYDTNILKGVKSAIDYAKGVNKPVVVNLSLGNNNGPHDGSSAICRELANYGKDAVIVVAAGNEGDIPMSITKNCSKLSKTIKTFLEPSKTTSNFSGVVEFYASNDKPFKFSVVIFDNLSKKIISQYAIDQSTLNRPIYIGGSSFGSYEHLEGFDEAYSAGSYLSVTSNVGTVNNRYGVSVKHVLDCSRSSNYYLGFVIEGIEGQIINGYANASNARQTGIESTFSSRGVSGWTKGSTNGTISDMACGDNVIVIGSYNTRNTWKTLGGGSYSYTGSGFSVGEVSGFSSYGTTFDGRKLPNICAPGAGIISSISSFYVNAGKVDPGTLCGFVSSTGRDNYWDNMQGTSMAAPFAAGTFALWLEADPTLTVDEVRDIATTTAIKDSYVTSTGSSVQWGAGKLDALAGIKEVLRRNAGVGSIMADDDSALVIRQTGNRHYEIFVAGEPSVTATLYNVSGAEAATVTADGDTVTLDASAVTLGVYILAVDGRCSRLTRKIVIR